MSDFRDFLTEAAVKRHISASVNYKGESPKSAKSLLIFRTSTQQTWLISTPVRLYCILDDRRKADAHIQWSMPIGRARSASLRKKDYREKTGMVDIGERKNYLYTKELFSDSDIISELKELIS